MKLTIAFCASLVLSFTINGHEDQVKNEKPFLTKSLMTKINNQFRYDLTKEDNEAHYMAKPDTPFKLMELKAMSVYYELLMLFRYEELINHQI